MKRQSITHTAVTFEESKLLLVPPATCGDERRRASRMPARLLVRCPHSRALAGHTRDVSSSGTFLETSSRPTVGSQHEITISVSERLIPAMVQVARHSTDGVGLTFMTPSSPLQDVLARLTDEVVL